MRKLRKTTTSFKEEASLKHNNFYNYEQTNYTGCNNEVEITCPIHGNFLQKPAYHLSGRGCPKCGLTKNKTLPLETFIEKANLKHNNFYDYSKTIYKSSIEHVTITCPIHGDFTQRPNYHLSGNGCTLCYKENNNFGLTKFKHSCRKTNKGYFYIIKCFNSEEVFTKIGITSQSVDKRFKRRDRFPYSFEIITTIEDTPERIFKKEKHLLRILKPFKYIPKIPFRGYTECFNINILNNYDFRRNEKLARGRARKINLKNKKDEISCKNC